MSVTPQTLTCMSKMGWEMEADQDSDAEQAEEQWWCRSNRDEAEDGQQEG